MASIHCTPAMAWLASPLLRGVVLALGALAVLFFGLRYARRQT